MDHWSKYATFMPPDVAEAPVVLVAPAARGAEPAPMAAVAPATMTAEATTAVRADLRDALMPFALSCGGRIRT
ncbi:hypothetical protein GCM10009838_38650 [Catenulispora subtropica]|uniref:Uncharacterized protein n=1 Tax=Catenulispora subtropica TaxID=450798 RepID=A0ABN2RUZ2_9ACTN